MKRVYKFKGNHVQLHPQKLGHPSPLGPSRVNPSGDAPFDGETFGWTHGVFTGGSSLECLLKQHPIEGIVINELMVIYGY